MVSPADSAAGAATAEVLETPSPVPLMAEGFLTLGASVAPSLLMT